MSVHLHYDCLIEGVHVLPGFEIRESFTPLLF